MSETPNTVDDSAERAYAKAADAVAAKEETAQPKGDKLVTARSGKAPADKSSDVKPNPPVVKPQAAAKITDTLAEKVADKIADKVVPAVETPAPKASNPVAKATTAEPLALPGLRAAPAKPAVAMAPAKATVKPAAKKRAKTSAKVAAKTVTETPIKAAAKSVAKAPAKPAAKKPSARQPAAAPTISKPVVKTNITPRIAGNSRDTIMTKTTDINGSIKSLANNAQGKAKSVIEKGSALIGETTEFTKGNVQAVVESGKILASGLQQMGSAAVTDTKDVISTIQADFKELASVKSPTELIEVQNGLMHRNFDRAIAYNSKASETVLKLANDMMAPISGRFSLAMQRVRKAA